MRDYRCIVDDRTYDDWFLLQRDHLKRQGLFLDDALRGAREHMEANFIRMSSSLQRECQDDYTEERNGDPYR